jgi:glutathione reductase (NADPH)
VAIYDYDLFVIGAGSGGVRAARMAATYGAKVAIAEEHRVGGACVIRGCVPKKLLVYASEFSHAFRDAPGYGWRAGEPEFDWRRLIANKDAEIDRLNGIYIANLRKAGVEILDGRAVLKGAHAVRLIAEDRVLTADKILVATGAAPFVDRGIAGYDLAITSNEAFHLERLPEHVVIAGGGYIAIEFAGIFRGLGSEVTLVYRGEQILRGFDRDVRAHVRAEMERAGIKVLTGTVFTRIADAGGGRRRVDLKSGARLDCDLVFWAIGRRPLTAGLGLEAAGVALSPDGAVAVDAYSRTNVENIYAVGDVTNRLALTPIAIREGAAFAETAFNNRPTRVDYAFVPTAVFSQPPVGTVGYSEEEARARFKSIDVYRADFRPMKNTMSGAEDRVLMKIVVDSESGRVIGVHIVGEGAPDMAQCLAVAIKAGATKAEFDETVALHPTSAEELVLMREKVS